MDNDLSVLLKVILDSSGIGSGDISKIQKILEKYTVNVAAELDKTQLMNSVKQVLPQVIKEISKLSGTNIKIDIDDSLIEKSIDQVIQDGKRLEKELTSTAQRINKIQLSMDNGHGVSEYQNRINGLINDFKKYGTAVETAENETKSLQQIFNEMKSLSGKELITQANKFEQEFKAVKISIDEARLSYDKFSQPVSDEKVSTLIVRIQKFLEKNTNITKEAQVQLSNYIQELNGGNISLERWNSINAELKKTEITMSTLGRLGKSFIDQVKDVGRNVSSYLSVSSVFMTMFSKTRDSVLELKELDSILTEISKTSDLTVEQLEKLGNTSFKSASKYGKTASDYLTGIQEMARSGFYGNKGTAMAEQSLLAQAAGDMSADLANNYILATNAAYKYNGEAEKLNAVLDGQNSITNRNSVAMADMAAAMSDAGTVASSYRVSIEDLSAMIGTIEAVTKSGGSEVGNAIKAILINLQNVTSDKIVDTLNAANASMTEMVDGAERLRNPISILRDLAKTFNQLDEDDPLRAEILTNIGQKYHASKLGALLQNMEMFDKMLVDYSEGSGSAMEEAMKSANNWEGSLNKVNNTWTKLVNNLVDSNAVVAGINTLNGFLSILDETINKFDSFEAISAIGGGIAGAKGLG